MTTTAPPLPHKPGQRIYDCLTQKAFNTLIVLCKRNQIERRDFEHALQKYMSNSSMAATYLCQDMFKVGSDGRQNTTALHTLFATASVTLLRWCVENFPADLLCRTAPPELGKMTVVHMIAGRGQNKGAVVSANVNGDEEDDTEVQDELFDKFIPEFISKYVPVDIMALADASGNTPMHYLAAANNKAAYSAFATARASATAHMLGKMPQDTPERLFLDRAQHDIARLRNKNRQLRANVAIAERTSEELSENCRQLDAKMKTRIEEVRDLQTKVVTLQAESERRAEREVELNAALEAEQKKIAASQTERAQHEQTMRKERDQCARLIEQLSAARSSSEEMRQKLELMKGQIATADRDLASEEATRLELQAKIAALRQEVVSTEQRADNTDEDRIRLRAELEQRLVLAQRDIEALATRVATSEVERDSIARQKERLQASQDEQARTAAQLKKTLGEANARADQLEEQLEAINEKQRNDEQQSNELRAELLRIRAANEANEKERLRQTDALRAANEHQANDLADTRRLYELAKETAAAERRKAEEGIAEAKRIAAEEMARATERASQLSDAKARAAELELTTAQYAAQLARIATSAPVLSGPTDEQLAEMELRVKERERQMEELQAQMAAQLEAAQKALRATRATLRNERATQTTLASKNRELTEQVSTLKTSQTLTRSPSLSKKRQVDGHGGTETSEGGESLLSPRSLTPRGKTLLRKASTIRLSPKLTTRRSDKTGRRSVDEAIANELDAAIDTSTSEAGNARSVVQIAQLVNEGEEAIALANYRLNDSLWKGLFECVRQSDLQGLTALLAVGVDANTREPSTGRTLLEVAVRAARDMHSSKNLLGKEAVAVAKRMPQMLTMIISHGGDWDGLDAYIDALPQEALSKPVADIIARREDIAPFCSGVIKDLPDEVQRHVAGVADLDRVPRAFKKERYTFMHIGCRNGSARVVYTLVRAGASTTTRDYRGRTPLHVAIAKAKATARLLIVEYLLAGGADPSEMSGVAASDPNLSDSSDDDISDEEDSTPLPRSSSGGVFSKVVNKLKSASPSKSLAHGYNTTPMAMAQASVPIDHKLIDMLQDVRYMRVDNARMQGYILNAIRIATLVEEKLETSELRTTDYEYRLFEIYGNVWHGFNPHFIAIKGRDYTRKKLRAAADVNENEIGTARELDKIGKVTTSDANYVKAALTSLATKDKTQSNASARWLLCKDLEMAIYATEKGFFDVAELIRQPACDEFDEACLNVLRDRIKQDALPFVQFMMGRRDRLFGPDLDIASVLDASRDMRGIDLAAMHGSITVFEWFMSRQSINVDEPNPNGRTIISIATNRARPQPLIIVLIDYLASQRMRRASFSAASSDSHPFDDDEIADDTLTETVFKHECHYGLVSQETGNTALHLAVQKGRWDLLDFCIGRIPRHMRTTNRAGETPVQLARRLVKVCGNSTLYDARKISKCLGILEKEAAASHGRAYKASSKSDDANEESETPAPPRYDDSDDDFVPPPPPAPLDAVPSLPGGAAIIDSAMDDALSDEEK